MTLQELGQRVKNSKEVQDKYGYTEDEIRKLKAAPDEFVARKFLDAHPNYWDMIGPSARRLHELMNESTKPTYLLPFLKTNAVIQKDRRDILTTIAAEANTLLGLTLSAEAEQRGVDIPTLMYMKTQEHELLMAEQKAALERQHLLLTAEVEDAIELRRSLANQQRSLPANTRKAKRKALAPNKPSQLDPEDGGSVRHQEAEAQASGVRRTG